MRALLCRYGVHGWRTVAVTAVRGSLCSVTASCRYCPVTRHEQNRQLPRREVAS